MQSTQNNTENATDIDYFLSDDETTRARRTYLGNDQYRIEFLEGGRQGETYEGELNEDKNQIHGKGVYTLPNGTRYEGEWMEGKMHGSITMTEPNGHIHQKIYVHGNFRSGMSCNVYYKDVYKNGEHTKATTLYNINLHFSNETASFLPESAQHDTYKKLEKNTLRDVYIDGKSTYQSLIKEELDGKKTIATSLGCTSSNLSDTAKSLCPFKKDVNKNITNMILTEYTGNKTNLSIYNKMIKKVALQKHRDNVQKQSQEEKKSYER